MTARLEALARRAGLMASEVLTFADVDLDTETGSLKRSGRAIELAPRERDVLELLMRHPHQVLETAAVHAPRSGGSGVRKRHRRR